MIYAILFLPDDICVRFEQIYRQIVGYPWTPTVCVSFQIYSFIVLIKIYGKTAKDLNNRI